MHIITGLLLTGLLGHKRNGETDGRGAVRSPILRAPSVLSIVHALPGRTRFRVPALEGATEASAKLEQTLSSIEGVERAEVSPVSCSVLVEHDPERVAPDVLAAALVRLLGLERELTRDVEAKIARELREFSRAANRAVYEKTAGLLDVRTAVLLLLAGVGVRKVLRQGSVALPAGFTLLWWAGNGLLRGRQTAS